MRLWLGGVSELVMVGGIALGLFSLFVAGISRKKDPHEAYAWMRGAALCFLASSFTLWLDWRGFLSIAP